MLPTELLLLLLDELDFFEFSLRLLRRLPSLLQSSLSSSSAV